MIGGQQSSGDAAIWPDGTEGDSERIASPGAFDGNGTVNGIAAVRDPIK